MTVQKYLAFAVLLVGTLAIAKPVSHREVRKMHEAIDTACAYNSSGSIIEVQSFNAAKAMAEIRANDKGCESDREYSYSREDAIRRFNKSALQVDRMRECLDQNVTKKNRNLLDSLLNQKENLGVFASEMTEGAFNPEACMYYDYVIYYQDEWSGRTYRAHFTFNYTD